MNKRQEIEKLTLCNILYSIACSALSSSEDDKIIKAAIEVRKDMLEEMDRLKAIISNRSEEGVS